MGWRWALKQRPKWFLSRPFLWLSHFWDRPHPAIGTGLGWTQHSTWLQWSVQGCALNPSWTNQSPALVFCFKGKSTKRHSFILSGHGSPRWKKYMNFSWPCSHCHGESLLGVRGNYVNTGRKDQPGWRDQRLRRVPRSFLITHDLDSSGSIIQLFEKMPPDLDMSGITHDSTEVTQFGGQWCACLGGH